MRSLTHISFYPPPSMIVYSDKCEVSAVEWPVRAWGSRSVECE